jgi:hypothetical protein
MDPNFSFSLNLAGVQAANGGQSLTEGYYAGTIVDAYQAQNNNGGSRIVLKIGNFEGFGNAIRTTSITMPSANTKPGLLNVWRAALESMGYQQAQLDVPGLQMNRDTFVNRPIHIYYKPGDRDAGIYDEMKILSPSAWATQKASFEASSTSAIGAAAPAPVAAPVAAPTLGGSAYSAAPAAAPTLTAPTNGVPQGQTPDALRNMLGLPSN